MDVIRFADVQGLAKGKGLKAIYTVTKPDANLSSHDWVGLFKEGWSHTRQYLAFEWAPREPEDPDNTPPRRRRRSVLFPPADIEDLAPINYQLVYIDRHDEVRGKSRVFSLKDSQPCTPQSLSPVSSSIECLFVPESPSPTLSSSSVSSSRKGLSGFEMVDSRSSSEEELVYVDHIDVTKSLEHVIPSADISQEIQDAIGWDNDLTDNNRLALVPMDSNALALVKYDKNKKAIVPYRPPVDSQTFVFSLAAKAQAANSENTKTDRPLFDMTPISTRFFTTNEITKQDSPATASAAVEVKECCCHKIKQPTQCRRCRHLQTRLRRALSERDALREKQQALDENLRNQEEQVTVVTSRLQNVIRENERLQKQQSTISEDYSERLKKEQNAATRELDMLTNSKRHLEEEISELRNQNVELNEQLDSILYSLSVQGVSGIKDNHGAILDLSCIPTDPARPPLSADGWKVVRSKKEERLVSGLRDKERQIHQLQQQIQKYQDQSTDDKREMEVLNNKLQNEKDSVELLQKRLVEMDGQLYDVKQHVIVLKDMLDKEDKRYVATVEEAERKEVIMQGQISRLTRMLRDKEEDSEDESNTCTQSSTVTTDIPPVVTEQPTATPKKTDDPSTVLNDPAVVSASWNTTKSAPSNPTPKTSSDDDFPPVPLAGLFAHNPTPTADSCPEKPPKKKMKKAKKLAAKKPPVYYPSYEPMKPTEEEEEAEKSKTNNPESSQNPKFKIAAANLASVTKNSSVSAAAQPTKKRKFPFSPPIVIKDNACCRCGMAFPVGCSQEKIEKHRALHRKVGV